VTKLNAFLKNNKYPLILGVSTSTLCFALDAWPQVGKVLILCAMMVGFQCGLSAAEEIIKKVSGSLPLQSANQSPSGVTSPARETVDSKYTVEQLLSGGGESLLSTAVTGETFWHCQCADAETFGGPFATEADAIEDAKNPNWEYGSHFALASGTVVNLLSQVNEYPIILRMEEMDEVTWLDESLGDHWSLTKDIRDDLTARLRKATAEWMVAHELTQLTQCDVYRIGIPIMEAQ
jgi:hypothetical protein